MGRIILYYHGGAANHGCEAIIRSTHKILGKPDTVLFSSAPGEDTRYGLDELLTLREDKDRLPELGAVPKFIASVSHKLRHDDYHFYTFGHPDFFRFIQKGDVCLSIGGDNYCYKGQDILGYYNKKLHRLGAKTVLWGCSVDPDMVSDAVRRDLASYDLIVARETHSYEFLKSLNPNTRLCCDPAFQLDKAETALPPGFVKGGTVGLNASPLAARYGNAELFFQNYVELIRHITEHTDYQIALIPHVVKPGDDDRAILKEFYDRAPDPSRIVLVEDRNCSQLKTIISECAFFIGARTHATIAAYSSCVPTLVTGYSIKARGIAEDLFGTAQNYVIPVQSLQTKTDLTDAFGWLSQHADEIRCHLESVMPKYATTILDAKTGIEAL